MRFITLAAAILLAMPARAEEATSFMELPTQDVTANWEQLLGATDLECHFVAAYAAEWTTHGVNSVSVPFDDLKIEIMDIDVGTGWAIFVNGATPTKAAALVNKAGITFVVPEAPTNDGSIRDLTSVLTITVYPRIQDGQFVATYSGHTFGYSVPVPTQFHALCAVSS